jgi:hypothetical protein
MTVVQQCIQLLVEIQAHELFGWADLEP